MTTTASSAASTAATSLGANTAVFDEPRSSRQALGYTLLIAAGVIAPFIVYPTFLMKVLCFALFACAFNLLLGFAGAAVVRPRRVLRHGGLCVCVAEQELRRLA